MVNIKNPKCVTKGCKIQPNYNKEGETRGLYCKKHAKENMIDVVNKKCIIPLCGIVANCDKYKGYCSRCFIFTFPDDPLVKNFKTKEKEVFIFLKEKYSDKTLINDKTITDGCSKRRPDVLIDLGYQVLITEIDENKHEDYNTTCEHRRIMEISQDLGHRPVVFIRFNPDDYIDKSGNKVKSCWKYDKKGFCKIEHKKDWDFRLNTLKTIIDYYMTNIISKTVEISHLFFDE